MDLLTGLLGGALIATLMFVWLSRRKAATDPSEASDVEPVQLIKAPPVLRRDQSPPNVSKACVEELVLGDPDAPLMRVRLAPRSMATRPSGGGFTLSPAAKKALAGPLQHAPRLLLSGANAVDGVHRLVVTFSPDTAKALASGALELTPSAKVAGGLLPIARDASGKRFVENGVLVPKVDALAVATAAWQVAAIVTSQKFLDDINTKLAALNQQIQAVRTMLEDGVVGCLMGHADYLRDRATALRDGRFQPVELQAVVAKLEDIDGDARGVARQMLLQLERMPPQLRERKWGQLLRTDNVAAEIATEVAGAADRSNAFFLAGEVRLLVLTLRGALDLSTAYATTSVRTLEEDISQHDALWRTIATTVEAKLPELSATMQWADTNRSHRERVQQAVDSASKRLKERTTRLSSIAERIEREIHLHSSRQEMNMLVEVDGDGQIRKADMLLEA